MTKGRRKTMDSKQVTGQDVSADVKKTSSTSKRKQSATHLELQQHQATATHMNSPTKPPPQKKSRPPTQPSHAKQPLVMPASLSMEVFLDIAGTMLIFFSMVDSQF